MVSIIKSITKRLDGIDKGSLHETIKELRSQLHDRFVILYGESDDLLEIEGVFKEEFGAYDGFSYHELNECHDNYDPDLVNFLTTNEIVAKWCPDEKRSWEVVSNNHHHCLPFNIMEDGEVFGTGLIIDLQNTTKDLKANIKKIENQICEYREYYTKGSPRISDEIFDSFEEQLRELCPESEVLKKVGTKNKTTGKTSKVIHETKMLSLDKVYIVDELLSWSKGRELISLPKIDGCSCSLIYIDGELVMAKTRGDGQEGEDITEHVGFIYDIPKKLNRKISIEVRGEIYCKKSCFQILSNEMVSLGLDAPSSERNIVAGLIGRKSSVFLCKYLDFYAYTMIEDVLFVHNRESDSLRDLRLLSFSVPRFVEHTESYTISDEIKGIELHKNELDFLIDGIVFVVNLIKEQTEIGYTSHHPKFKMAFKFKSEDKDTIIEDIKWQVSRNGVLTPVAVVKTVELSGANVSNVTLHNFGIVRDFNLKIGDTIKITRSGEVIPKFLSVVISKEGEYSKPSKCPSCEGEVFCEDIRLFCKNPNCSSRIKESILNFISMMNIEDINEKRVEELLSKGIITNIESLYNLTVEKLLMLDKVKEKSANKIYNNIQNSKSPKLAVFLVANGISSLGLSSCEKIIESGYTTLDKFLDLTVSDIISINGFSDISATNILNSMKVKRETILQLVNKGVIPLDAKIISNKSSVINGKSFCITGTLTRPRKDIEEVIKSHGANVVSSVSSKTDYLLTNDSDNGSTKSKKALELGVKIVSEAELDELLQGE